MLAEVNMLKVRKLLSYHSESGSTDENTILRNNFNLKITPEVKVAFYEALLEEVELLIRGEC